MKKLTGSRIGNLIVVAAVIIVPLLYAGLLTLAYQNPTNRLGDLTAAVVNQDTAYTATLADGSRETFDLGHELEERLTHPDGTEDVGFTWKSMDAATAEADMTTEKVRAILYIPADFSKKVSQVGSKDPAQAATQQLRLVTDDGVNYLAGTMAKTVAVELTNRLDDEGSERVIDTLLMSVSTIRDGMVDAADGAGQLRDGTGQLRDGTSAAVDGSAQLADGANTLTVGIRQLADGSVTLRDGLVTLADGTATAADGSGQLASGLDTLADGTATAAGGSTTLAAGAQQVADGTSTLRSGASALAAGAGKLTDGATQLGQGVDAYTAGVDQLAAGAKTLQDNSGKLADGVAALKAGVGTANDSQPTTIMGGINGVNSGASKLAQALKGASGSASALTAGAQSVANGAQATKDGIQGYTQAVAGLVAKCEQAQSAGSTDQALVQICAGLTQLSQQSSALNAGASQLSQGATGLSDGVSSAVDGLNAASTGASQLAAGTAQLRAAATDPKGGLVAGVDQLATAVGTTKDSQASTLLGGINLLSGGLQQAQASSNQLRNGATALTGGLGQLGSQVPTLVSGVNRLDDGAHQVSTGANDLASGLKDLRAGAGTAASKSHELANGLSQLSAGASTAASGSTTLADGLGTARSGSDQLADGATQLADGATQLDEGASKLDDGATTLADGLDEGVGKIPSYSTSERSTMSKVASDVANVDAIRDHGVVNNGAGFTPMFMSLSLWVGAIALFLVLPALDKRDHGEKWWASAIRPATTALMLAIAQAVIMMVAVNAAGELHAKNLGGLALMAVASSICFMAVNQACVAALAFRGRFVSIVLLSLQITSMGATFPIETTPKFFQWVHPFLPMSYTQLSFRRLIAGAGVDGIYGQTLAVLLAWTVVAVFVTLLGARFRRGKRPLPADNALAPTAA